jgi:hypothetical protein
MNLRSTSVVFCAIDNLIGLTSKALIGFPEFVEGLAEAEIPLVPVTGRGGCRSTIRCGSLTLATPLLQKAAAARTCRRITFT